jgi:hypothetical protein
MLGGGGDIAGGVKARNGMTPLVEDLAQLLDHPIGGQFAALGPLGLGLFDRRGDVTGRRGGALVVACELTADWVVDREFMLVARQFALVSALRVEC